MYELNSIRELKDYFLSGTELFSYKGKLFTVEEVTTGVYVVIFRDSEDMPTDTIIADSLLSVYALF